MQLKIYLFFLNMNKVSFAYVENLPSQVQLKLRSQMARLTSLVGKVEPGNEIS